uniref:Interleukin n=1 Tax=Pygocentrus nattereri TaxID=42514 RepID=A0AAR2LJ69_PYGNA
NTVYLKIQFTSECEIAAEHLKRLTLSFSIFNSKHDCFCKRISAFSRNIIQMHDCCSWSALECFNSQLLNIPTSNKDLQAKLHKNLRKKVIVIKCQSCNSYPMIDSHEFMKNLLSLLQKVSL